MTRPEVLLAVDGNSLVHRSFHAQAGSGLRSASGRPIWAVRGLLTQLVAAVDRTGADAVVVGFDDPNTSRRREQWPQYKANRTEKLPTLVDQLSGAAEVLRGLGVPVVVPDGLEADDVLASAARYAAQRGTDTVIMTSDRDAFALIDERTRVLRIINGGVEASPMLTPALLVTMLGIRPEQYRDFAALRGDPSDNLPGVRGIGPKTAARLLQALGGAREVFADLDRGSEAVTAAVGRAAARALDRPDARAVWELNCRIMHLHDDVELGLDLGARANRLPLAPDTVREVFAEHQLAWTTVAALRTLAHTDPGTAPPVPADTRPPTWAATGAGRRRPARLPAPASAGVEQLSLF